FTDSETRNRIIHHHGSRLYPSRQSLSSCAVSSPNAGSEPKLRIIRQSYSFVLLVKGHDRQDWTKSLLAHDAHLLRDIGDDSRCVEIGAKLTQSRATCQYPCPTMPSVFHLRL